jgi:nitrate reductase NapAB chaperone NapD
MTGSMSYGSAVSHVDEMKAAFELAMARIEHCPAITTLIDEVPQAEWDNWDTTGEIVLVVDEQDDRLPLDEAA